MALVDVLAYDLPGGDVSYRAVEAGRGSEVVAAHEAEFRKRRALRWALGGLVALVALAYSLLIAQRPLLGVVVSVAVLGLLASRSTPRSEAVPSVVAERLDRHEAARKYELDVIPSGSRP